jgi:hypothetical protein
MSTKPNLDRIDDEIVKLTKEFKSIQKDVILKLQTHIKDVKNDVNIVAMSEGTLSKKVVTYKVHIPNLDTTVALTRNGNNQEMRMTTNEIGEVELDNEFIGTIQSAINCRQKYDFLKKSLEHLSKFVEITDEH